MLKSKITVDTFKTLPEVLQAEYVKDGEGYRLDFDLHEQVQGIDKLKTAKQHEKELRQQTQAKVSELQDKLDALEDGALISKSEFDKQVKTLKDESESKLAKLNNILDSKYRRDVAERMSEELTGSKLALAPHIMERLTTDLTGEEPRTLFLSNDKSKNDLTYDNLKQEFVDNKDFSSIIKVSKASGGRSPQSPEQRRSFNGGGDNKDFNLRTASTDDAVAFLREKYNNQGEQ